MKNAFLSSSTLRHKQGGVSLMIAMVALVAMTFAGLALMRAVDTTNVISGNLAFRQSALLTTDIGVETALTSLNTIVTTSIDVNWPAACAPGACNYYSTMQVVDATGVPTVINWALVPKDTTADSAYAVQYVIDRLCDGPAPVTDIATKCMRTDATTVGTKTVGNTNFSGSSQVYYRATVRVLGPRNTVSLAQALVAR